MLTITIMGKLMELGSVYHLLDHAVNKNNVFENPDNYRFFLERYESIVSPIVDTMAYCLMPNHFHFAIRIKNREALFQLPAQLLESWQLSENSSDYELQRRISKQFSNFFSSYTQAFNKQQSRRGALFEGNFCRLKVTDRNYYNNLISYIHHNPVKHGFCDNFKDWFYSSYATLVFEEQATFLRRDLVFPSFGGKESFIEMQKNWKSNGLDFG
jgi:putative transposase